MRQRQRQPHHFSHTDTWPFGDADASDDSFADSRADGDANRHAESNPNTFGKPDADAGPHSDSYGDALAHADFRCNADAHSCTDANPNPDAARRFCRNDSLKRKPISRSAGRMRSLAMAAACAVPAAVGLVGCGSHVSRSGGDAATSGSALSRAQGRATFTFTWPARTATRLIPVAANSLTVNVLGVGGAVVATQTIARPASGAPTATVTFGSLNVGVYTVTATAYPNTDGTGTAQAQVRASVTIVGGQTVPLDLGMATTIVAVGVTPGVATLSPAQTATLTATPTDAEGKAVLVSASTLTWASSNTGVATVDSTGKITALSAGSTTITATETESGKSGTASITVSTVVSTSFPKATTYQMNPAHSGSVTFGQNLNFTSSPAWSVNLGSLVSYPLIAGGKIFVTVGDNNSGQGTELYALDETTGHTVWGPIGLGGYGHLDGLAYENGKVFAINEDGLMQSFDAATGTPGWSAKLPGQYGFSSPATAVNGIVYTGGAGTGGTVYALDETNGNLLWSKGVENGDNSSPAVALDSNGKSIGVYVSYPCQDYDFNPTTGASIWRYDGPCEGGGGKTAAYANGFLYTRDTGSGNLIFDASTGKISGSFNSVQIPALGATTGFFMNGRTLQGINLTSRSALWSFAGDGNLITAPIVIDQTVITGSASGKLYALNATTGAQVWSGSVGTAINGPDEQNGSQPLTGLAAGEGYLVVPAGTTISAWHIAGQ